MNEPGPARHRRETGYFVLGVTIVGWGLNWPLIRLLLREWPPLVARGSSALAAGFVLAALAAWRGQSLLIPSGQSWRVMLAAFVNVTVWMGAPTLALLWLSVAECALLVYTMALWAMLLAWPLKGERPTAGGALGLALAFFGLAILFPIRSVPLEAEKLPGIALTLAGAVVFAVGTLTIRAPAGLAPIPFVAWQVGLGALPLIGLGVAFEADRVGALTPAGIAAFVYMTLVPMGLCYLTWFAALGRFPARTAATAILLVPVVGIGSAALIVGEPFGPREALALLLVLSGVALAIRRS